MQKKPDWLRTRISNHEQIEETAKLVRTMNVQTICDNAECPNIGECFGKKTATFMILGELCTRRCRFCAVGKGEAGPPDPEEPARIGKAVKEMGLRHVVVTSVTRDDLPDGGAMHFVNTVREIRKSNPDSTVELLIPDLMGNWKALALIAGEDPEILNHNVETVPALYEEVRPKAVYERSLLLLKKAKEINPNLFTKSGIMVGLGETEEQVRAVMDDLRAVDCDILTIGQYMQPSPEHIALKEYVTPETFERYRLTGLEKGFSDVAAGPFVRSSYNAAKSLEKLAETRSFMGIASLFRLWPFWAVLYRNPLKSKPN